MSYPDSIRIVEVGPRDGLQNESGMPGSDLKIALIERLANCGLRHIEAGAFVSPRRVPQMADTAEVLRRIKRHPGVCYSALVPNEQGLQAALAAGVDEIAVRRLIDELARDVPLAHLAGHFHDTYGMAIANICAARDAGITVFDSALGGLGGCPYAPGASGNVATEDVVWLMQGLNRW